MRAGLVTFVMLVSSLLSQVMAQQPDLLNSWRRAFPFTDASDSLLNVARESNYDFTEFYQKVDTSLLSPSLSYAQSDLRLPIVLDGLIPAERPFEHVAEYTQNNIMQRNIMGLVQENRFRHGMLFALCRHNAVNRYAIGNLKRVDMFRSGKYDLPTERTHMERLALSGIEQVDTEMGLQLGSETLDIESITFHADKWHRKGTTSLQMAQTAFSDNWYQGGENNFTVSNYDKLVFSRYDEQKITTFDLSLELRLSGYYTKSDTINPMRVNDNLFRIDVSYGYKAWRNWYYSTSAYVKTPIFDYHNANSKVVKSSFLSPLEVNVSVGMDLKLTKNKRCQYSLLLAPLSYNLKYVNDSRVKATSYGIDPGHCSKNQFGASITNRLEWKINDVVSWTNRTYFFTSYHSVQAEFENTFNVALGRYCTAKLYAYPRFDDSRDDRVQYKEMLTFGLSFVW